jgi:hypothetical protein
MTEGQQVNDRRTLRRQLLAIVARRQQPGSGSNLAALDVRRVFMEWWADAERALQDILHAVAGAMATNAYAPERATNNIDMAVLTPDGLRAHAALRAANWELTGSLWSVSGTTWRHSQGYALDLPELDAPWVREAIAAAQENRIAGMPTLTLPYLVLMKLLSARAIDIGDLSRMLGRATDDQVAAARTVVMRFGHPNDVADFDQLVHAGRLERQRGSLGEDLEPSS